MVTIERPPTEFRCLIRVLRSLSRGKRNNFEREKGTALQSTNKSDGKGLPIAFDFWGPENDG